MKRQRTRSPAYRARRTARKAAKLLKIAPAAPAPADNSWDLEGNIARSLAMKP